MVFEIDESSLPFVRTRHALLAVDLQNDFASPDGPLAAKNPPNFVENILNLASNFRSSGNVIWVRTVFETSRPVNVDGVSENVVTDTELPVGRPSGAKPKIQTRASQKTIEKFVKLVETNGTASTDTLENLAVDDEDQISETYLTLAPGQSPLIASTMSPGANILDSVGRSIDTKRDLVLQKTYYSAFRDGSLLQTLRAKFVTEIYICGALTNISVFATAMDAARHGYAITVVEDCLGYRSKARHDEALRKLDEFTGCDIISSKDLIRDLQKRERARSAQMARPTPKFSVPPAGRGTTNLEGLLANLNLRPAGTTAPLSQASAGPEKSVAAAEGSESSEPADELRKNAWRPQRTASTEVKRERVKTKIKSRRRHSKSGSRDKDSVTSGEASGSATVDKVTSTPSLSTSTTESQESTKNPEFAKSRVNIGVLETPPEIAASLEVDNQPVKSKGKGKQVESITLRLDDQVEKMADLSVKEEPSGLCEGDTTIIHDLLDSEIAGGIFERVRDEVRWQKMSHQGGEVPRLVAVQGEIGEDGSIPIYRHPADESPPLLQFSPVVSLIRKSVEEKLGHPVNHVLIQFYRDGNDYISEHSDKTLDIVPRTFIANVSLGAQRTMVFRTKKQKPIGEPENTEPVQPRQATRSPLPHNSMCRMGLMTNMRWLHGIRQDKRMTIEKTADELAYNGGRISLTFRQIGTFLSKDQQRIWGQGAICKTQADARTVINGDSAKSEKMIRAFGKENQASEFDWEAHYGEGFDVLHIENTPKLFLSGDKVADLRVKLMLAEYGVEWKEGALSPLFNWKNGSSARDAPLVPENLPVKFVDNDLSKSTIVGDLAIMLYFEAVYGPTRAVKSQIDLARQFTRFQQSCELLRVWRAVPFNIKLFRIELELWDGFAAEDAFIAGNNISLADYGFWPLLDEIYGKWDTFDDLENLSVYYKRLREMKSFWKVLGGDEQNGNNKDEKDSRANEKEPDYEEEEKANDRSSNGEGVSKTKELEPKRKQTA